MLVMSCDKYQDVVSSFCSSFEKFWPNSEFDRFLVSETIDSAASSKVFQHKIFVGNGLDWMGRLNLALQQIQADYILLLCDDYFLVAPYEDKEIRKSLIVKRVIKEIF